MSDFKEERWAYRRPPKDVAYTARVEAPNCDWCQWKRGDAAGLQGQPFGETAHACDEPTQRHTAPPNDSLSTHVGLCRDWNREGACTRFVPSVKTRLLRLVGLRRPAK